MQVIPYFLKNPNLIVEYCDKYHQDDFLKREGDMNHSGFLPNINSRFKTLTDDKMNKELIDLIFSGLENRVDPFLKDMYSFIQIQRYDIGDYIVPHRDSYYIKKLMLFSLTDSSVDGLVVESTLDRTLVFIPDQAGQYIDFSYDAIHWVNPIRDKVRYSLVIGI